MKKLSLTMYALFLPMALFAQSIGPDDGLRGGSTGMTVESALGKFVTVIIQPAIALLFAGALLLFFWGLFNFMMALSAGEDTKTGKNHMMWSIVGMVIMFSVLGIMNIITGTIGAESVGSSPVNVTGGFK